MFHAGACCVLQSVFPPIDIQQALIEHTQCPCRFVILLIIETKALQSQASRQIYKYTRYTSYIAIATRYQLHTRGFAGGRVRVAFEANARRQRTITAKGSLRCQGPLTHIPINPGRLEKLILMTDCVYTAVNNI